MNSIDRSLRFVVIFLLVASTRALESQTLPVIPRPLRMERSPGAFRIADGCIIVTDGLDATSTEVALDFKERLSTATGARIARRVDRSGRTPGGIRLVQDASRSDLSLEGYELRVTPAAVELTFTAAPGLFHAIQTVYQLLPAAIDGIGSPRDIAWAIPAVHIVDRPRFSWRGMHLDVCRHFFPVSFIKKYIDVLAMYKMNTFHWHLTDDQGWRIEIKTYPKLASIASQRRETMGDGTPHGGFYTQAEIRDVVAYAKKRFITIVPEIEMPGHARAALAAYPELSCTGGPFDVATTWGVFDDVFCAGNEKTFTFLEKVLTEVMALFPGDVIHIGGDECPKTRWNACDKCRARMTQEGLADASALQSWFIRRIEKFVNAKGRRIIGWDEILEGGLAPNASVMSWRGMDGGIAAAKSGHTVVMSPTSHCYFDYAQGRFGEPRAIGGFLPLDTVYAYDPVPPALTATEAAYVLGVQGNMWTEWMPDERQVEYMLLPRLCAMSEVAWTAGARKDPADFARRLESHYDRFTLQGLNFRVPPPEGLCGKAVMSGDTTITLSVPVHAATIRYTIDGSDPSAASTAYAGPIHLQGNTIVRARTFLENGRTSAESRGWFRVADRKRNGLAYAYYEGTWTALPEFGALTPLRSGIAWDIDLDAFPHRADGFAVRMTGWLDIPAEGAYTLYLTTDDGGRLELDGSTLIDADGLHTSVEKSAAVRLAKGRHAIVVSMFEATGDQALDVSIAGPGMPKQPIPPSMLFREDAAR